MLRNESTEAYVPCLAVQRSDGRDARVCEQLDSKQVPIKESVRGE
jgi:hypothetical protein